MYSSVKYRFTVPYTVRHLQYEFLPVVECVSVESYDSESALVSAAAVSVSGRGWHSCRRLKGRIFSKQCFFASNIAVLMMQFYFNILYDQLFFHMRYEYLFVIVPSHVTQVKRE